MVEFLCIMNRSVPIGTVDQEQTGVMVTNRPLPLPGTGKGLSVLEVRFMSAGKRGPILATSSCVIRQPPPCQMSPGAGPRGPPAGQGGAAPLPSLCPAVHGFHTQENNFLVRRLEDQACSGRTGWGRGEAGEEQRERPWGRLGRGRKCHCQSGR